MFIIEVEMFYAYLIPVPVIVFNGIAFFSPSTCVFRALCGAREGGQVVCALLVVCVQRDLSSMVAYSGFYCQALWQGGGPSALGRTAAACRTAAGPA